MLRAPAALSNFGVLSTAALVFSSVLTSYIYTVRFLGSLYVLKWKAARGVGIDVLAACVGVLEFYSMSPSGLLWSMKASSLVLLRLLLYLEMDIPFLILTLSIILTLRLGPRRLFRDFCLEI